ncbi:MAG: ATP synthase subunit I [Bacillota bacterium]
MDNIFSEQPEVVVKTITLRTGIIGAILLVSALVSQEREAALGLIFGLAVSLLLFRLKFIHSKKAIEMNNPSQADKYMRNKGFVNFFIYFVVLFVARYNPGLNFFAAAVGLLLLKFTIIGSAIMEMIKTGWQNYKNDR